MYNADTIAYSPDHSHEKSYVLTARRAAAGWGSRTRFFLAASLLLSLVLPVAAEQIVDTTIFGDGSPGPYAVGNLIVDTSSLVVELPDSLSALPWTFLAGRGEILFARPLGSGTPVRVRYRSSFYGVPHSFSLYEKSYRDLRDSVHSDSAFLPPLPPERQENLNVSGYKSFGASIGSFGQINLEQGLDVRIGGEIRPQTTVSAHLSDQGSSLDGATREISEFDMIYISLDNPAYRMVTGDQYVAWPFAGLVSGEKKIKGVSANFALPSAPVKFGGFGALSGGRLAVETQRGQTGVQGPYYLTGNGERDFIQPISGTVKVRLSGRTLEEGEDFLVDYDLGTITFTPRVLITDEDLIRLEYEYKTFNYQRTLVGADASVSSGDSTLTVGGVIWSERDNRSHPIDLALSGREIDSLERAGDRLPFSSSSRLVHPNDVAGESEVYPLYKRKYDSASDGDYWVYTPYDRGEPDSALGYYYVWFRPVDAGEAGDYDLLFTDSRGPVYVYAGEGVGTHTDLSPLPAPVRRTSGEVRASLRRKNLDLALNVAGQDRDLNLFSSLDDDDNRASATAFSVVAGEKTMERRSFWLGGSHRFTSSRFDAEVLSAQERKDRWDDLRLSEVRVERQRWDVSGGGTVVSGLAGSFLYGQNRERSRLITDKFSPGVRFVRDRLSFEYDGSFFRHFGEEKEGFGRRESGVLRLAFPRHAVGLLYRDEWHIDSVGSAVPGAGLYEGGVVYDYTPINLRERIVYQSKRRSVSGGRSIDTGYTVRFEQSVDHAILPTWHVRGESRFDHSATYGTGSDSRATTMLVDLESDMRPSEGGFSSRQRYRTNAEKASAFIQVPVFAGRGMGTHVYDSLRREYVPMVPGDYFMQQQEVYDLSTEARVRKTSDEFWWSYSPTREIPGILGDLSWEGALLCEEHVDAEETGLRSWVPGLLSLGTFLSGDHYGDPARFADLSYRQEVRWDSPDSLRPARGSFMVMPGYRKIRGYRESSLESRLSYDRTLGRLTLGGALSWLSVNHEDTASADFDYALSDRRLELTQSYRLPKGVTLTFLEAFGLAERDDPTAGVLLPLDSSFYYQLSPALLWRPGGRGSIQARYTYSRIPFAGEIDYRMARGFPSGVSHQVSVMSDVRMGERFLLIGSFRSDIRRPYGAAEFYPANNVLSLELRAFM